MGLVTIIQSVSLRRSAVKVNVAETVHLFVHLMKTVRWMKPVAVLMKVLLVRVPSPVSENHANRIMTVVVTKYVAVRTLA